MKRNNIEDLFLSEELSLEIRKLGFNEDCLARFDGGGFRMLPAYAPLKNDEIKKPWFCTSPTYQQVFDWFEEEFWIYCSIDNILLDYSVTELTKEGDIKILKPMHSGVTHKNKTEVKESCIKYIIKRIKQNETNTTTRN